jgi:hypothetical protein
LKSLRELLNLLLSNESVDEFFNDRLIFFVHSFDGLELIDQIGVGKFCFNLIVRRSIDQKVRRDAQSVMYQISISSCLSP